MVPTTHTHINQINHSHSNPSSSSSSCHKHKPYNTPPTPGSVVVLTTMETNDGTHPTFVPPPRFPVNLMTWFNFHSSNPPSLINQSLNQIMYLFFTWSVRFNPLSLHILPQQLHSSTRLSLRCIHPINRFVFRIRRWRPSSSFCCIIYPMVGTRSQRRMNEQSHHCTWCRPVVHFRLSRVLETIKRRFWIIPEGFRLLLLQIDSELVMLRHIHGGSNDRSEPSRENGKRVGLQIKNDDGERRWCDISRAGPITCIHGGRNQAPEEVS